MIIIIRIIIFILIIIFIKLLFIFISEEEFTRIKNMKELIDFTQYLRIFSCDMCMNLNDILDKYSFKNDGVKKVCENLGKNIELYNRNSLNNKDFCLYVVKELQTPKEFNVVFSNIIDFYGNSTSEILKKKLIYIENQMIKITNEYEEKTKERKILFGRVSILIGILVATLLI